MGRASRRKQQRRAADGAEVLRMAHDLGDLVCSNCGRQISPNEMSFSTEFGDAGALVSCFVCAPALMEVLDAALGTGRCFRDGWARHCSGEVDAFDGYVMRREGCA